MKILNESFTSYSRDYWQFCWQQIFKSLFTFFLFFWQMLQLQKLWFPQESTFLASGGKKGTILGNFDQLEMQILWVFLNVFFLLGNHLNSINVYAFQLNEMRVNLSTGFNLLYFFLWGGGRRRRFNSCIFHVLL